MKRERDPTDAASASVTKSQPKRERLSTALSAAIHDGLASQLIAGEVALSDLIADYATVLPYHLLFLDCSPGSQRFARAEAFLTPTQLHDRLVQLNDGRRHTSGRTNLTRPMDLEAATAHLSADDWEGRVRVECRALLSSNRLRWQGDMTFMDRHDPFACIQGERILPAARVSTTQSLQAPVYYVQADESAVSVTPHVSVPHLLWWFTECRRLVGNPVDTTPFKADAPFEEADVAVKARQLLEQRLLQDPRSYDSDVDEDEGEEDKVVYELFAFHRAQRLDVSEEDERARFALILSQDDVLSYFRNRQHV